MKTPEIMNEPMENNNTKNDLAKEMVSPCDRECEKRGKRNLILLGLVFIILFVAGYFINPGILKNIWLIASGTLAVITGLLLFLVQISIVSLKCE